jgi:hypothetical protein
MDFKKEASFFYNFSIPGPSLLNYDKITVEELDNSD